MKAVLSSLVLTLGLVHSFDLSTLGLDLPGLIDCDVGLTHKAILDAVTACKESESDWCGCLQNTVPTNFDFDAAPVCASIPTKWVRRALALCEGGGDAEVPLLFCPRQTLGQLDSCEPGETPTIQNNCPSCKVDLIEVVKDKLPQCQKPALCDDDERPYRGKDGCLTCRLPASRPQCGWARRVVCQIATDALPLCSKVISFFDKDSCCPTCKRPQRPSTNLCTKGEYKQCLETTRDCEEGEKPVAEEGQCCKSCIPQRRKERLDRVVKCTKILRKCDADEKPAEIIQADGSFTCPTCIVPRPVCNAACGLGRICGMSGLKDQINKVLAGGSVDKIVGIAQCLAKKVFKGQLSSTVAEVKEFLQGADGEEVREAIKEVVERVCENPLLENMCERWKQRVVENIGDCSVKASADSGIDVECEVTVDGEDDSAGSRRLLDDSVHDEYDALQEFMAESDSDDIAIRFDDEDGAKVLNGAGSLGMSASLMATTVAAALTLW